MLTRALLAGAALGGLLALPGGADARNLLLDTGPEPNPEPPSSAVPVPQPATRAPAVEQPVPPTPPAAPPIPATRLVRGLNLNWWATPAGSHNAILRTYHQPGVRERVQTLLADYRAQGYGAVRVMVWWQHGMTDPAWGIVPSSFPFPYPQNLAAYVTDIRAAGFTWLEIAFGPAGVSNPIDPQWQPMLLEDNWRFMVRVRETVEQAWPGALYDLLNEGGSHPGIAHNVDPYIATAWDRWEAAYGLEHATVSFHSGRWPAVQRALDPDPAWWEVHVYDQHGAPFDVPADAKPVVVGESYMGEHPAPDPRVSHSLWWPIGRAG